MRVTLIAAQSLDGYITKHDVPGTAFTSNEDKAFFRAALAGFDCSVMGGNTYRSSREAIRASTASRLQVVLTRHPENYAADAIPGKLEFTARPVTELVVELRTRGFKTCALVGGSQIHSLFFAAGLVDEVWLTLEPLLFGGGTRLLVQPDDVRLHLLSRESLSIDTLLLKYEVRR